MARMGDMYTSRVPAGLLQELAMSTTAANAYISDYNIYMGYLVDSNMHRYFPEDLRLITHWGLRDELKANYTTENGLAKQKLIYQVMNRIIDQTIPMEVINSQDYLWDPFRNKVYEGNAEIGFTEEGSRRFNHWLENFKATKAIDPYHPHYKDYVQRRFESGMEIPVEDVKQGCGSRPAGEPVALPAAHPFPAPERLHRAADLRINKRPEQRLEFIGGRVDPQVR